MSSTTQVLAHRQPAVPPSGPTTPESEAASAPASGAADRPAAVLPHESVEDYQELARQLMEEFEPESDHEDFLVDQMFSARWKILRFQRLQELAMEQILTEPGGDPDPDARLVAALAHKGNILDKLDQCVALCERSYHRALRELQSYRARSRRAEANALDAWFKKVICAPLPGHPRRDLDHAVMREAARQQNEARSKSAPSATGSLQNEPNPPGRNGKTAVQNEPNRGTGGPPNKAGVDGVGTAGRRR